MISSNGGSWSNHDGSKNNCIKAFSFSKDIIVDVEFDPT
jgi:hypothetical protein